MFASRNVVATMPKQRKCTMSTLKQLNAVSINIVKASAKIDDRIQAHLVNIAAHINGAGNGDTSAASFFVSLLSSSGLRRDAIVRWIVDMAGCTWKPDELKFGRSKNFKYDAEKAKSTRWTDYTPQHDSFKGFDLNAKIEALVKQAAERMAEVPSLDAEKAGKIKINLDKLNALRALIDLEPTVSGKDAKEKVTKAKVSKTSAPAVAPVVSNPAPAAMH